MNVLVTHECSGVIREAMRSRGINAYSCDLKPAEDGSPYHIQGDALKAIEAGCPNGEPWDIIIMHPECTFLNSAGLHWNNRGRGHEKTEAALQHVRDCMETATKHARIGWALENPAGRIGTEICPWTQSIHPYQFGDDASKTTGLWLKNLPRLRANAAWVEPRWVCPKCNRVERHKMPNTLWQVGRSYHPVCNFCDGLPVQRMKPRWANQTDSGQNRLAPGPTRAADRARTYQGIARAMATQWGGLRA